MSRCWEILGIEATSDTRLIKRAYAKLLKVNRPEDDAEAFQRLRDAHDEALARAAWMLEEEEEEEEEAELVESATQEAPLGSPVTPLGEDVIRNEFAATLEEDPRPPMQMSALSRTVLTVPPRLDSGISKCVPCWTSRRPCCQR